MVNNSTEAPHSPPDVVLQGVGSVSSSLEDTLRQELNGQREVAARLRHDLAAARQHLHDMSAHWEEQQGALQEQLQVRGDLVAKQATREPEAPAGPSCH